jgi:tRNA wybutosine-synthesizing protein 2
VTRPGPVDRVRLRLARRLNPEQRGTIPDGYQRLGSVVVVKLPESLRPHFAAIGEAYRKELGVASVLRRRGPVSGDFRVPSTELLAGTATETEVRENGVVYRFDAARVMFAAGNGIERLRLVEAIAPGEVIADLFAGIGYFTLPIAVHSRASAIVACEANPTSFGYLRKNLVRNRVDGRVEAILGPNETADLPEGEFDRVVLGFLPSSLPWIARAVPLLRPDGAWLHVHEVVETRQGVVGAEANARAAVGRAGGEVVAALPREVKPYGPGRVHTVVDVRARPR